MTSPRRKKTQARPAPRRARRSEPSGKQVEPGAAVEAESRALLDAEEGKGRAHEPEEDASVEDPLLDWPDEERREADPRKDDPVDE